MESFLEILKFTIPGLVVFATAYWLLKQFLDDKYKTLLLYQNGDAKKVTLPLRLQAYERLALLCERVELHSLVLRVRMPDMKVRELQSGLLIGIRQEFEHNTSQQVYVSETLWQIVNIAVGETMSAVNIAASGLDPMDDSEKLVDEIFKILLQQGVPSPLQRALQAIRTEAATLF